MVVIFVPNVNECQATQKFIRKLYIKNLSERKNGLKSKDLKKLRKLSEYRKKKTKRMEYHLGIGKKAVTQGREETVG